jgi:hypothetical protein
MIESRLICPLSLATQGQSSETRERTDESIRVDFDYLLSFMLTDITIAVLVKRYSKGFVQFGSLGETRLETSATTGDTLNPGSPSLNAAYHQDK